ncbi:uncharacterized protein LOC128961625 [Oppia nitens]|uniref:uncharacterized protein LOC128961625 n=1 Tax=Oppia nitens TaxID=1686743 RepID=UPI0023DA82C9|nr:uncharacterized protein LOC128961625 [Oppia nitens]
MNLLTIKIKFINVVIILNIVYIIRCDDDDVFKWDADMYPRLTESVAQAKFCTGNNRNPPTNICDPDGILDKKEAWLLDNLIDEPRNQTQCLCDSCPPHKRGLNIKVALVKTIKVYGNVSLEKTVEMFAEKTRRKWRVEEQCSNDVLIFYSVFDDQIFVAMGANAHKVLTDNKLEEVLIDTKNHFTSGYYQQGLESMIASFQDFSDQYEPKSYGKLGIGSIVLIVICVTIASIVLLFAVFWFCVRKDRKTSESNRFEFIGSCGRSKNKHKNKSNKKTNIISDPIYKPVSTNDNHNVDNPMKA